MLKRTKSKVGTAQFRLVYEEFYELQGPVGRCESPVERGSTLLTTPRKIEGKEVPKAQSNRDGECATSSNPVGQGQRDI